MQYTLTTSWQRVDNPVPGKPWHLKNVSGVEFFWRPSGSALDAGGTTAQLKAMAGVTRVEAGDPVADVPMSPIDVIYASDGSAGTVESGSGQRRPFDVNVANGVAGYEARGRAYPIGARTVAVQGAGRGAAGSYTPTVTAGQPFLMVEDETVALPNGVTSASITSRTIYANNYASITALTIYSVYQSGGNYVVRDSQDVTAQITGNGNLTLTIDLTVQSGDQIAWVMTYTGSCNNLGLGESFGRACWRYKTNTTSPNGVAVSGMTLNASYTNRPIMGISTLSTTYAYWSDSTIATGDVVRIPAWTDGRHGQWVLLNGVTVANGAAAKFSFRYSPTSGSTYDIEELGLTLDFTATTPGAAGVLALSSDAGCTLTAASPAVLTIASQYKNFADATPVILRGITNVTGITDGTTYYLKRVGTTAGAYTYNLYEEAALSTVVNGGGSDDTATITALTNPVNLSITRTGTATGVASTNTTVTATAGIFPTSAATVGKILKIADIGEKAITAWTSTSIVTFAGEDAFAGKAVTLCEAGDTFNFAVYLDYARNMCDVFFQNITTGQGGKLSVIDWVTCSHANRQAASFGSRHTLATPTYINRIVVSGTLTCASIETGPKLIVCGWTSYVGSSAAPLTKTHLASKLATSGTMTYQLPVWVQGMGGGRLAYETSTTAFRKAFSIDPAYSESDPTGTNAPYPYGAEADAQEGVHDLGDVYDAIYCLDGPVNDMVGDNIVLWTGDVNGNEAVRRALGYVEAIIAKALQHDCFVVVGELPPCDNYDTPIGINTKTRYQYNRGLRALADRYGVNFVPLAETFTTAATKYTTVEEMAYSDDGVHPSTAGDAVYADMFAKEIEG